MKTKTIISTLFLLFSLFICSCSKTDSEPTLDNASKNFWERNMLTYMQLKGNVKTVTRKESLGSGDTCTFIFQFNKNGYMTSCTVNIDQKLMSSSSIETINYNSNNQITSDVEVETDYSGKSTTKTTSFTYGTHGKYVPEALDYVDNQLVLNLTTVINNDYRLDYIFKGDNLLVIKTRTATNSKKDTTFVTYSGNYPTTIKNTDPHSGNMSDITYATNGMYKSYKYNNDSYIFKDNNDYLLVESSHGITDSYNEHYDLSGYTYTYDSHGNWTSKSTGNGSSSYLIYKRVIEYWE